MIIKQQYGFKLIHAYPKCTQLFYLRNGKLRDLQMLYGKHGIFFSMCIIQCAFQMVTLCKL